MLASTRYLSFEEQPNPGRKTKRIRVLSVRHGYDLGTIRWYSRWRQYVFEPERGTLYNKQCLVDLADRLKSLNAERK